MNGNVLDGPVQRDADRGGQSGGRERAEGGTAAKPGTVRARPDCSRRDRRRIVGLRVLHRHPLWAAEPPPAPKARARPSPRDHWRATPCGGWTEDRRRCDRRCRCLASCARGPLDGRGLAWPWPDQRLRDGLELAAPEVILCALCGRACGGRSRPQLQDIGVDRFWGCGLAVEPRWRGPERHEFFTTSEPVARQEDDVATSAFLALVSVSTLGLHPRSQLAVAVASSRGATIHRVRSSSTQLEM